MTICSLCPPFVKEHPYIKVDIHHGEESETYVIYCIASEESSNISLNIPKYIPLIDKLYFMRAMFDALIERHKKKEKINV